MQGGAGARVGAGVSTTQSGAGIVRGRWLRSYSRESLTCSSSSSFFRSAYSVHHLQLMARILLTLWIVCQMNHCTALLCAPHMHGIHLYGTVCRTMHCPALRSSHARHPYVWHRLQRLQLTFAAMLHTPSSSLLMLAWHHRWPPEHAAGSRPPVPQPRQPAALLVAALPWMSSFWHLRAWKADGKPCRQQHGSLMTEP